MELYNYKAKVVNIVDGDTIDVEVDVGFHMRSKLRLRLLSVYAPEIRGPKKTKGIVVKAFVMTALEGQEVIIKTEKTDDFCRWLAVVYLPTPDGLLNFNEEINKFMQGMG